MGFTSGYILLPYRSSDYSPFLEVMHEMWPEFTFTHEELVGKEMVYAGELSRLGVWKGNRLLACCNVYPTEKEFFVSWFYRQDEEGTLAVKLLIDHMLEVAHAHAATLTSRVLDAHPIWLVLKSFGFLSQFSVTDWVVNIEQLVNRSDLILPDPEMRLVSLDWLLNDRSMLQQIYELELDRLGKRPPWLNFQVFHRNMVSIPSMNTRASTVLVRGSEVQAYALVFRHHSGEDKIRKIVSRSKDFDYSDEIIKYVASLSKAESKTKIWISTDDRSHLGHVARVLGFVPAYTWIKVARPFPVKG